MTYRKLLLILAAGALLLTLLLLKFIPWEALVTLLFLLGIMVSPIISQLLQIAKARLTPTPHYQPSPEQPPLKSTYQQGYQEQTPANSVSWPYRTQGNDQPKQDPPGAWDQPQMATPEQAPPLMQ